MDIVNELLSVKLNGQAENATKLLNDPDTGVKLSYRIEQALSEDHSLVTLHRLEGWAAQQYFQSWRRHLTVPFDECSAEQVPKHWWTFNGRVSPLSSTNSKQYAADPINAMLNYGYSIGYAESRAACIVNGLDPRLGFLHTDKRQLRDSLALDVLEAIRPTIDRYILGLLGYGAEPRQFTYRDFTERARGCPPGTVRLVAPLTHEIAEQSYIWYEEAQEITHTIVRILTGSAHRRGVQGTRRDTQNQLVHKAEFQSRRVTVDEIVPDELWNRVRVLFPIRERNRPGTRPIDPRILLAAFVYCRRHDAPLSHVPQSLGVSYQTVRHHRRLWQLSGHWSDIERVIVEHA